MEMTVFCPYCAADVTPVLTSSGPHLRADCPTCGVFVKFVPLKPGWRALFNRQQAAFSPTPTSPRGGDHMIGMARCRCGHVELRHHPDTGRCDGCSRCDAFDPVVVGRGGGGREDNENHH